MSRTLIIPVENDVINLQYKKLPTLDDTDLKGIWHLESNRLFLSSRAYNDMVDAVKLGETAIREVLDGVVKLKAGDHYAYQDEHGMKYLNLPI